MVGKTVFFLGAGATIDVVRGAPSNKDLVKKALEDFKETPSGKEIWGFIQDVFKDREKPPTDNQIWNLLDYIVQEGKSPSVKYNLERILDLRESLLNLVIKEFKKTLDSPNIFQNTYKDFVASISNQATSIISTNYDIFIDNALREKHNINYGVKIRFGLLELAIADSMYQSGGFKRPIQNQTLDLNCGDVKLMKIHGSLNWLYCNKCDEIDILVGQKIDTDDLKELYCENRQCTDKYEPLLITPTMFKNYENRIIKETWHYAEKELIRADNLVFIGYSLKEEDYQIRCLLMKALLNKDKNYNKVIIIDKNPKDDNDKEWLERNVGDKYRDLYGSKVVRFETIGFKKFVETIGEFGLNQG